MGKFSGFQVLCPIHEVWPIEIRDVVSDDYVRIHLLDKVPPSKEKLCFIIKRKYLRSDDV